MSAYAGRIRAGLVAPWVGEGVDGARRSAQVAREEFDTLPRTAARRAEIEEQAEAWDALAETLERDAGGV